MIDLIESYLNGRSNDFYHIVGQLEGALDASEINDKALILEWYNFWTPLEIRRATEGKKINKEKAIKELVAMKEFLITQFTN